MRTLSSIKRANRGAVRTIKAKRVKESNRVRPGKYKNVYSHRRWRYIRAQFLQDNPVCVHCLNDGVLFPANTVDHIEPHAGDLDLMWDTGNLQALCKRHHDIKTWQEQR